MPVAASMLDHEKSRSRNPAMVRIWPSSFPSRRPSRPSWPSFDQLLHVVHHVSPATRYVAPQRIDEHRTVLIGLRGQHVLHVLRQLVESHGTVQRLLQRRGTDRNVSSFSRGRSATAAVELHRTAACRRRRQVESPPEHHGGTAPARPPAETHGRRFLQTPARTRTHRQGPADRLHRSQAPRGLGRDTRLRQPQRRPYREHQRRVAPPSR